MWSERHSGIVTKPSYDLGYYCFGRGVNVAFPILERNPIHTKVFGEFRLEHMQAKPVALYVVSNCD